jgi:hypothetical protein
MDNQNQTPQINQQINPSSISQPLPPQSSPQTSKSGNSMKVILSIVLVLLLVIASAFGGYYYEHSKATTKENDLQAQITSLQKQVNNLKAPSGNLQATESVDTMVKQTLNYLATYKQQNGQYPTNETTDLDKLVWSYNYNFKDGGGPDLTCPQDSRYLTYVSLTNQTTHQNDTFTLYYCNGNKIAQKTQADIQ